MERRWAGRIGAAVLGAATAATALAVAVIRWYPDARGLNRLYAGIFLGVAAWIVMIFYCLLAVDGRSAWRRVLAATALAGAAIALDGSIRRGI